MRENHYGMLPVQLISGYASAGHYWRASSASGQGSQRTGRSDSETVDMHFHMCYAYEDFERQRKSLFKAIILDHSIWG